MRPWLRGDLSPAELAATPGKLAWSWEASYPSRAIARHADLLGCRKWILTPFK
jgi:hypothetical protein